VSVLLGRGGGSNANPPVSPTGSVATVLKGDRVARISQAGSKASLARVLPLPSRGSSNPRAVVVAEGAVWVANEGDGTVTRMEPVNNRISASITVGTSPNAIAYGEGSIWVVNRLSHNVSRIDPGSNKVVATIPVNGAGFPSQITVGEGAVWLGVDGGFPLGNYPSSIHRIDPGSNRDVASIPVGGFGFWVVVTTGDGSVWAAGYGVGLLRIDPATNEAHPMASPNVDAGAITFADGSLWIAGINGQIARVDPATGEVEATVLGGGVGVDCNTEPCTSDLGTLGIAAGGGIVWVTNKANGSISRVLISGTSAIEPIDIGQTPTGVALGYGSVWVTVDA
jgi:YVTN family beta-propeller protein